MCVSLRFENAASRMRGCEQLNVFSQSHRHKKEAFLRVIACYNVRV